MEGRLNQSISVLDTAVAYIYNAFSMSMHLSQQSLPFHSPMRSFRPLLHLLQRSLKRFTQFRHHVFFVFIGWGLYQALLLKVLTS